MLLAFLTIGYASCDKDNNGNNTNDEIIEYQGEYPAPENIEYAEDGVTYEIEAIPGQIIISADVDYNTVVNAVKANGGTIIQQYPQYGDYLVEVVIGSENAYLTAMNKLNITADLNIVEYPKEKYDYFVFDDFIDVNGIQHGKKVSSILSDCQTASVINEVNLYTSRIPNWVPLFGGVALNLGRFKFGNLLSQNQVLVNWSNGYGNNDDDWQSMTEEQKQNFTKGWKMSVKLILDKIIWLKRMSPGIDIVFAQAAGNEKCPEMAQMINDLKSNPKYKTILEENMIFVSDYSAFANTSTEYGDFCYIKEHAYYNPEGGTTSFAAPQALCYINQVIKGTIGEDGKNITAVQALAAVKAAIRQNSNGELDLDEALEMAGNMYSPMSHEIIVTPNELTFEAISSGYQVINVVVNSNNPLSWTAICNESWVHLSVTSGTNDTNMQVSVDNNTLATSRNAEITFSTETGTVRTVSINQKQGSGGGGINDDWVDLGLLSGTIWATHNVGATSPEGYGSYFAWGETAPKTRYYWDTYKYGYLNNEGFGHFTKYVVDASLGPVDNLRVLEPMDDAATVNWGNGWRMPTHSEWYELCRQTTSIWTTQNGVHGRLFTGSNGKSLFLPATGEKIKDYLKEVGNHGYYWSGSLYGDGFNAACFGFNSTDCPYAANDHDDRYIGFCVRPVRSSK